MNTEAQFLKIELLFKQSRIPEAKSLLEEILGQHPDNFKARLYYVSVLLQSGQKEEARRISEALLADYPDSPAVLDQSIRIDLDDEYYEKATSKLELLQEMAAGDSDTYTLTARLYLKQRNYDRALKAVNQAIAIEPNDLNALNLKILIEGILGNTNTDQHVEHALSLDPENAGTQANHALKLLKEGKVEEALERVSEALRQDPTNEMARYVMAEAMKSRFWLFRLFFKYSQVVGRLTSKGSWTLIIGGYIAFRLVSSLSENYPVFLPVFYILLALFILSWLVDPLFNLYLYFNKHGRLLLDEEDKIMALSVGGTLLIALGCQVWFLATANYDVGICALMFAIFAIPLSSFLKPNKKANQTRLKYYTGALILSGLIGCLISAWPFIPLTIIGTFIYQFVVNNMIIKENARVIG